MKILVTGCADLLVHILENLLKNKNNTVMGIDN